MIIHSGATHAFDRNLPDKVIHDPYAHKGAGGPVLFQHSPEASAAARQALVAFFHEAFGLPQALTAGSGEGRRR
jgi:hypothetical protein